MRVLVSIAVAVAFFAALFYATLRETGVQCEVCIEFEGSRACRTGSASDREAAVRGAVSTACAVLSSGVTRGIRCDSTPPVSVSCTP